MVKEFKEMSPGCVPRGYSTDCNENDVAGSQSVASVRPSVCIPADTFPLAHCETPYSRLCVTNLADVINIHTALKSAYCRERGEAFSSVVI